MRLPLTPIRTRRGWRLVQHGTVLSEILGRPGPTHSVFDVLAAAVLLHPAPREVAVLGFGGGGIVAALRASGCTARVHGVDLDPVGHEIVQRAGLTWMQPLRWHHGDAVTWLRRSPRRFDVIVDDLSVSFDDDVVKPVASWDLLPRLVCDRLRPGGLGVFNLLRPMGESWRRGLSRFRDPFPQALALLLDEFENRLVLAPRACLPSPAVTGRRLRHLLRDLGSRQADRIRLRARF